MAIVIDVAATGAEHIAQCGAQVTILPAERVCFHTGDKPERLDEFVDRESVLRSGTACQLIERACEHFVVRTHKCAVCGTQKSFGGPA